MLEQLIAIDYSDEIARLPHMTGFVTLAARGREEWVTVHYSGVPGERYADRSEAAELRRIINEAAEHLRRDWSPDSRVVYGDGMMYDFVILTNGKIVRTRAGRQQLWHCGNDDGNERSWSVHVMLGTGQDLSAEQRASLFRLLDALRAVSGIPRGNVVGHNEWPRVKGLPKPSKKYQTLFGQSSCPGPIIHAHVAAYRAIVDAPATGPTVRSDAPYTAASPILGPSRVSKEQLLRYTITKHGGASYTEASLGDIIGEYAHLCALLNIDLGVAGAQLLHETDDLRSWWADRPRRNPAGLGVTGATRPNGVDPRKGWAWDEGQRLWREGLSFTAWCDIEASDGEGSISHHLGRLLAYALPAGGGSELQQRYINRALARRPLPAKYRGIASASLAGLVGTWAWPGWKLVNGKRRTYADNLAEHANIVFSFPV